jgi:hypothetical protein
MVEKYELVTITAIIVLIFSLWLGIFLEAWTISYILSIVPYFIFTAIVGVFVWGIGKKIEKALGKKEPPIEENKKIKPLDFNSNFRNIEIFYHRLNKEFDSPEYSKTVYVANSKAHLAYQVDELPEWFSSEIKDHKMIWYPNDDLKSLKRHMYDNFDVKLAIPSPKGLGLQNVNGKWVEEKPDFELSSIIKGEKLEHLQIAKTERRYFFSIKRRVLLIDNNAKEVWQAPLFYDELIDSKIVGEETYGMKIRENCEGWSMRMFGYKYIPNRYPESKLLAPKPTSPELKT